MGISRRTLLRGAGTVGMSALLSACTGKVGGPRVATSVVPPPAPMDYNALAGKLSGQLLVPGKPGYERAARSYNPLFDDRKPAAVAQCARPEDVQACVSAAAASKTPIAARSGGHSYAGYSTPDGALVVDLSGLAGVDVRSDGTAVIGSGAKLMDVYTALARAGRCLPAGTCPTVGIAGLTLGGGVGVLTRKYGLTCDRMVSAQIVTADGQLRTVSASTDADLFWALRGGGGGNFGIVTSFAFATEPAPELTVFSLDFPSGADAAVFGGWQSWLPGTPDELWTQCVLSGGVSPSSRVVGCYVGSQKRLAPLLDDFVRRTDGHVPSRYMAAKDYLSAMRFYAGSGGREKFAASSRILSQEVRDPSAVTKLVDGKPDLDVMFDSLGGAVSRVAADATAFPHRSALATVQIYQRITRVSQADANRSIAEVRDGLAGMLGPGGYVNYIDPAMPSWGQAYYGQNLTKLRQVAKRYDPDRVFSFPQSAANA